MINDFDYEIKGYIVEWFDGQSHSKHFVIAEDAVGFAREKRSCVFKKIEQIRIIQERYIVGW